VAIDVAVLLSAGRHPVSGRGRRAPGDARALELALELSKPRAIHAGDAATPSLRDYLGMGLDAVTVLDLPPEADPVPTLIRYLETTPPDLVLAGCRAETGEDSGMVPYIIAEALGFAMVPGVAEIISIDEGAVRLLQALPRGQRRAITAPLPLVATVDMAAPAPRQNTFAIARRGRIHRVAAEAVSDSERAGWEMRPARQRPRRLGTSISGLSAAERLSALTEAPAGAGRQLIEPTPDEAARAIYDYLIEQRILPPPANNEEAP
jgi:electron transfer flavoprotein beta subunit